MNSAEVLKMVLPLMGGSVATFFLAQWWLHRTRPRLAIRSTSVAYTLSLHAAKPGELKVYYKGVLYDNLTYHSIAVENSSKNAGIDEVPFLVTLGKDTKILDVSQLRSKDVPLVPPHDPMEGHPDTIKFKIGKLLPLDRVDIGLLVEGSSEIKIVPRCDPKILALKDNEESSRRRGVRVNGYFFLLVLTPLSIFMWLMGVQQGKRTPEGDHYTIMTLIFLLGFGSYILFKNRHPRN